MSNKVIADFLLAVHLAYVAFAVLGMVLILLGLALGWQWVRNLRFRVAHLVMVEVVALEGVFNIRCPLTDLEAVMRAGGRPAFGVAVAQAHAPPSPMAIASDEAEDPSGLECQPVSQQDEPAVAVFPVPEKGPTQPAGPPAEDADETFVGWLLGSILYVSVPQATLDKWYVVFGILTLVVFVAFPPRRGAWSMHGFTAMILLWIGCVFQIATVYDVYLGESIRDYQPPLALGAALIAIGVGCAIAARCNSKASAPA